MLAPTLSETVATAIGSDPYIAVADAGPLGAYGWRVNAAAIARHFELLGVDNPSASEIYTEDAILEYVQSGERIRGRDNITASRQAYPGRPTRFFVHRCTMLGSTAAVELVMHIDGDDPHPVVAILDLRGDAVCRERIYIAEPWPAPAYRAAWVESLTDSD